MRFRHLFVIAIIGSSFALGTLAHAQSSAGFDGIRPDRSPVNPNEFDKIRPPQSPVNPNEFDKIRPQQSPVNPNEFRKIRPDATGFDDDIQVMRLDDLRVNPNEFRAIDPDRGIVIDPDQAPAIDPDEGFDGLEELAPIREAGAVQRARQFGSAFAKVQERARELEPGAEALPLGRDVEELTRGAEELGIRFTRVGRDFDELGYTARANRAEQVARLFDELQARLALFGLEIVRRGDVTTIPADLEFNFELLEEALIGFPEF